MVGIGYDNEKKLKLIHCNFKKVASSGIQSSTTLNIPSCQFFEVAMSQFQFLPIVITNPEHPSFEEALKLKL